MKSSDRIIVMVLAGVALVAGFWFLVLSPKRAEISELDQKVQEARTATEEQEQLATFAETAEADYEKDYQELVVLGKAVPSDSDQASLVEQLNAEANDAGVTFDSVVVAADGDTGAPAAPAATEAPPAEEAPPAGETTEATPAGTTTAATVPATEAAAATMPIGATVGTAGLPVISYDLAFGGEFFNVADFLSGLDSMVKSKRGGLGVSGRLLTVDGFSIAPDEESGFPQLDTSLRVKSYVAPADQGLTGGATPAAPAPATSVATTSDAAPPVAASGVPSP